MKSLKFSGKSLDLSFILKKISEYLAEKKRLIEDFGEFRILMSERLLINKNLNLHGKKFVFVFPH